MDKKTIIYIMSDVRSGSTLLENILSKSKEVISVGELYHLDSHLNKGKWGVTWGWRCSCGKEFQECGFWENIFHYLKEKGTSEISRTEVLKRTSFFRTKAHPLKNRVNTDTVNLINEIYTAIFNIYDCNIIVDSSKDESQLLALYENTEFDLKVIYLRRDIRAVTISKYKWALKFGKKRLNRYKVLIFSMLKNLRQRYVLKKIDKNNKVFIRYEDLARDTQNVLNKITLDLQMEQMVAPIFMELREDHTVAGTPNRFQKRKIQYDDSWEKESKKDVLFHFLGSLLDKL